MGMDGAVAYRGQAELSVCAEGKRPGTWVDNVDGHVVHAIETFSSRNQSAISALKSYALAQYR